MILRISFLVVTSVAAVAVSHFSSCTSRKRFTAIKPSENVDSSYRQEQIEGEEEEKVADTCILQTEKRQKEEDGMKLNMKNSKTIDFPLQVNKLNNVIETDLLQNLVKELGERRMILEGKLLELYGLEEEQSYVAQLRKQLKSKTGEINKLNFTIKSLQADRNELLGEIECNQLAEKQLQMAKRMIMEIQAKMGVNANKMKGKLTILEKRVSGFEMETNYAIDATVEKKFKALNDAQLQVVELKRRNRELQLQKRDLTVELAAAEARVSSLSNMTESEIVAEVEEDILGLRQANKDLSKQIERLQKNRLLMVEELVYQRWLNACLRFEIQNYHAPSMNQKPTLKKISSDESNEKTKQLKSRLSFDSISSPIFSPDTDSDELTSTTTTTFDSSSISQTSIRKKASLFHKIKKWGKSKDNSTHISSPSSPSSGKSMKNIGLIRRFSMSMVPSNASTSREKGKSEINTKFSRRPSSPQKRRVSFSDAVMTFPSTFQYMHTPGEETSAEKSSSCNTTVDENSNTIADELSEREKSESPMPELAAEKTGHESDVKTEVTHIEELDSRKPVVLGNDTNAETRKVDLMITALFFFLLILLAYCILLTTRIYKA